MRGCNTLKIQIQASKYEESISCDKFSKLDINERHQEAQSTRACQSPLQRKEPPNLLNNANGNLREEMSENSAFQEDRFDSISNLIDQGDDKMRQDTREDKDKATVPGSLRRIEKDVQIVGSSASDTSPAGGKNFVDQMDYGEFLKPNESIKESVVVGVQEEEKVDTVQRRKAAEKTEANHNER